MKLLIRSVLSVLVFVSFVSVSHAETVVVANNDWLPYNTKDGGGLVDQIVKEAFAEMGYEVTYKVYPWKRAYETVKDGESDITYPWSYTDQRVTEITFNDSPLVVNQSLFWYKTGTDFSWSSFDDLKKYRIGGMIGYSDTDLLEAEGIEVNKVKDEVTNLKKLMAGRIDAFAMNLVVGSQILKENFSEADQAKIQIFDQMPLVEANMHAVFSPNARGKKLAADFEQGLQKLIASGRYDEILFK